MSANEWQTRSHLRRSGCWGCEHIQMGHFSTVAFPLNISMDISLYNTLMCLWRVYTHFKLVLTSIRQQENVPIVLQQLHWVDGISILVTFLNFYFIFYFMFYEQVNSKCRIFIFVFLSVVCTPVNILVMIMARKIFIFLVPIWRFSNSPFLPQELFQESKDILATEELYLHEPASEFSSSAIIPELKKSLLWTNSFRWPRNYQDGVGSQPLVKHKPHSCYNMYSHTQEASTNWHENQYLCLIKSCSWSTTKWWDCLPAAVSKVKNELLISIFKTIWTRDP